MLRVNVILSKILIIKKKKLQSFYLFIEIYYYIYIIMSIWQYTRHCDQESRSYQLWKCIPIQYNNYPIHSNVRPFTNFNIFIRNPKSYITHITCCNINTNWKLNFYYLNFNLTFAIKIGVNYIYIDFTEWRNTFN